MTSPLRTVLLAFILAEVQCANIVEVLNATGATTLVTLLENSGLAKNLSTDLNNLTLFAPSNAAFEKLPPEVLEDFAADIIALKSLLLYHVVGGRILLKNAVHDVELATLDGVSTIRINVYLHNKAVTAEGANITRFDLMASNGVIHIIDRLMTPPETNIFTLLKDNAEYTTLVRYLEKVGLQRSLIDQNVTIFAPTNTAFLKLNSFTISRLEADSSLLKEVLQYHVVPETVYSAGLYDRDILPTLDKDNIRIFISSGKILVQNGDITKTDVSATNGVIHVIDHVLIPPRDYVEIVFG